MEYTGFFAQLWGSFFVIFGVLFVVTRQLGKTIEMTEDRAFVISTGYITLLMGLVTVLLHNVWVADWRVAITVLGWSTLIKGIMKVGFPEHIHKQAQRFKKKQWLSALLLVGLGAWLFCMGFAACPADEGPQPPAAATVPAQQDDPLRGQTWTWVGTYMNDGSVTEPREPDAFTMTLGDDGTASFTTDCNRMFGSYEATDTQLSFGLLASTKMYCEGSQETDFASMLPEVQSYLFDDGRLILEIKYDSGIMTFR
ncbi:META domain-containing protein [Patescibacteria group bacterium]